MTDLRILPLTEAYIPACAQIERLCLSTAWSENQLRTLPKESLYLVALADGIPCGIASLYVLPGEAELQNLATLPAFRRQGVANALLREAFSRLPEVPIFLEVAESNTGARALYEAHGFAAVGLRKGFYRGENAIVMRRG